jgi:AraC-like DNA-binding protein
MKDIVSIVEAHLDDSRFSVTQLCREAGISHPQLHRKLKAEAGLSAVQLIRSVRLRHGKRLLRQTKLPIADIAYDVGFSDPDYFSKVFRKEVGCTPSQYRETQKNAKSSSGKV